MCDISSAASYLSNTYTRTGIEETAGENIKFENKYYFFYNMTKKDIVPLRLPLYGLRKDFDLYYLVIIMLLTSSSQPTIITACVFRFQSTNYNFKKSNLRHSSHPYMK